MITFRTLHGNKPMQMSKVTSVRERTRYLRVALRWRSTPKPISAPPIPMSTNELGSGTGDWFPGEEDETAMNSCMQPCFVGAAPEFPDAVQLESASV
jgi:hypothetical protein